MMTNQPIEMPLDLYVEIKAGDKYVGELCLEVLCGIDVWGDLQCVVVEQATIERDDKCPVARAIWLAAIEKFRKPAVQNELSVLMFENRQARREESWDQARAFRAGE